MDDEEITDVECFLPVGVDGHCKYVTAILLTWLDNPEVFEENADLETTLVPRSKPELIALIRQILQRYPDKVLGATLVGAALLGEPTYGDVRAGQSSTNAAFNQIYALSRCVVRLRSCASLDRFPKPVGSNSLVFVLSLQCGDAWPLQPLLDRGF